jgi:hypothetical protein
LTFERRTLNVGSPEPAEKTASSTNERIQTKYGENGRLREKEMKRENAGYLFLALVFRVAMRRSVNM